MPLPDTGYAVSPNTTNTDRVDRENHFGTTLTITNNIKQPVMASICSAQIHTINAQSQTTTTKTTANKTLHIDTRTYTQSTQDNQDN